ncbi:MAG: sugar transferase [Actinomycetota bacterium]|nr:sugar transferase [Actinomycetota bacterium]
MATTREIASSTARRSSAAAAAPVLLIHAAQSRRAHLPGIRVTLDITAIGVAAVLAFLLRFHWGILELTPSDSFDPWAYVAATSLWVCGVLVAMASHRLYDEDTLTPEGREVTRLRRSLLEGVAVVSAAVFLFRLVTVSRGWFMFLATLSSVLLVAERSAFRAVLRRSWERGRFRRPAIVVTAEGSTEPPDVGSAEFEVVGTAPVGDVLETLESDMARPASGGRHAPILIVDGAVRRDDLWRLVIHGGHAGWPVFVRSPFRSLPMERITTRTADGWTLVKVCPPALRGIRAFEKRLFDLAGALVLSVVLAIPMVLIAIGVLMTSGRPVLYSQPRVGRGGRTFHMLKFRSMRLGAEDESGPVWAVANDPRRTRFGAILRRSSLDELPQLWNVLRGDMSLVGPRPERPLFVAQFNGGNPWYRFRLRIRPGITGLAQVRGLRGDTPLDPRVDLDNLYIEHWSLGLDLRIAARTVVEMVRGRNAH